MKRMCYVVFLLFILGPGRAVPGADLLTGITRLSCEALLCLSSPARPGACNPALSYYFAIKKFTWPATFAARLRFLNKCPAGSPKLARAVADKAPRKRESAPGLPGTPGIPRMPGIPGTDLRSVPGYLGSDTWGQSKNSRE